MRLRFFFAFAVIVFSLNARALPLAPHTFTFRLSAEPETLDWNRAHTPMENYVIMNVMEGLLSVDLGLNVTPALAESFTRSADQKTYTFKIRHGVKWTDGVELKAKDFVYSWKRLLSPFTAASYAYLLFDVEGAEAFYQGKTSDFNTVGVKALDDYTFQVRLAKVVPYWQYIPTFWVTFPLREDIVQKYGSSWETPGRMVTLGPYSLSEHDIDSKIVLRANPTYYGKRGNINEVIGLIVQDDSTALSLYEAGKLDLLTDISTIDLRRMSKRSDLKTFPYLKTAYMGMVTSKFPLTNRLVRRAIALSIDRSKFGEILHGGQQKADSFVPPRMMGYSKKIGVPFDPILGKIELRNAGFGPERPLNIELVIPNSDKTLILAQFIQEQLHKNLGANVTLQPFDHKTFRAQLDLHAYALFILSWSADYPDPDNFLSLFLGDSGNNRTAWRDDAYDQLVVSARSVVDPMGRERKYFEAQKILVQDQVVILPLYYEPNLALVRPRVQGLELNPLNYLILKRVNVGN